MKSFARGFVSCARRRQQLINEQRSRIESSASVIFWSLFGKIDRESFKTTEEGYDVIWKTGMTLFGVFNIVAVLVALNMLIAILNESYTRISQNLDTEWKFTRTKLWLSWVYKKGVLPPPFNILYVLLPVHWVMKRLFTTCCPEAGLVFFEKLIKITPKTIVNASRIDEQQRREVIRLLILRYLAARSCHLETRTESSDVKEDNEATVVSPEQNMETSQSNDIATIDTLKVFWV